MEGEIIFTEPHTISTLFSLSSGSDEIRQRNTAHARINGLASFVSKTLKVEIIASISWTSAKVKMDLPSLRNSRKRQIKMMEVRIYNHGKF